jgi:hypothetical protein
MKNLHRIMATRYQHSKPLLCPTCVYRRPYGEWEGYCDAKRKILSAPRAKKTYKRERCDQYQPVEAKDDLQT